MIRRIGQVHPATVIATAALFVALGGSAYSAAVINGSTIKVRSIPGDRLELRTLTGAEIDVGKLGMVPTAGHARSSSVATRALSVAAPRWQTLTLENGWTGSPFGTGAPAVANDNGLIFMKGAIATTGTNPEPFVLPASDRPTHLVDVSADMCNATEGRLQIESTGVVDVIAPGGTFSNAACFTSLDGIVFAP